MPEHAQAGQAPDVFGNQAAPTDLHHQRHHPDQSDGHMQAVRAHERKERRQKRAALWGRAIVDHVREFIEFDTDERESEQRGDDEPALRRVNVGVVGRLTDVAETKCGFTNTVQEERHEGCRGRLALSARDGNDAGTVDVMEPQIQRRRDDDAVLLEVQNVRPSTRDARTLQDDVATPQCLEATIRRDEYLRTETGIVVDEDEGSGNVRETTLRRATFDAVAKGTLLNFFCEVLVSGRFLSAIGANQR